jgi:hypothetical protein
METKPELDNEVITSSVPKTKKVKKTIQIVEDVVKSVIKQCSIQKRRRILYKIVIYLHLKDKANKHKKGQLCYVFEFLMKPENLYKFVKQGDILLYCDKRRSQDTNGKQNNFKDNSRQVEKMRKDIYPLEWIEVSKGGELWFKYMPQNKKYICKDLYEQHKNKSDNFKKNIIEEKLCETNYTCEITGLSVSEGKLAADHFIPKEKGGKSEKYNCIILNKILNEKKNKKMPIEWFCETILTNFMNICKNVGILQECKEKIIKFVQEF